jgi:hypothetical protein
MGARPDRPDRPDTNAADRGTERGRRERPERGRAGPGGERPPPRGASARGGPTRGPSKEQSAARTRVDQLIRSSGLPEPLAWQVEQGALTLNEALQQMANRDAVEALMRRHALPKSLAVQVSLKQVELEDVLRARRMDAHALQWREWSVLEDAQRSGKVIVLALHNKRFVTGTVVSVAPYEITFQPREESAITIHKLQIKFACGQADFSKVRSAAKRDPDTDRAIDPISRPQDRPGCSDKRLFGYVDDEARVVVTTQEGEVLKGTPTWMGRWEFGLKLDKGAIPVVVFRHAVLDVRKG